MIDLFTEASQGRKILLKSLVGSCNYNLNIENSDKDYKVFVAPTFEDLYDSHIYCKSYSSDEVDFEVHDIRRLEVLLYQSNINFLEVFFSDDIGLSISSKHATNAYLSDILKLKNDIATVNLPYLYHSSMGMSIKNHSSIQIGTKNTLNLIEKFGYNTKKALCSYRTVDFLEKFANNGFSDFKAAISYDGKDREKMLEIRDGRYSLDEFSYMLQRKHEFVDRELKPLYKGHEVNKKLLFDVRSMIKRIVSVEMD